MIEDGVHLLIDLKTRAVARFFPDARTFHNINKLQKHVLLRHQSYLIVVTGKKNYASLQLISDRIQIIRFYLSLVRSVAYGKSEVKLFAC
jgi:hypothetical protein